MLTIYHLAMPSFIAYVETPPSLSMLVGAYLNDTIEKFEGWSKQPSVREKLSKDEQYQFDHAFPLWKAGMETKALAMSYNPAGGKDHLQNVLKYLD